MFAKKKPHYHIDDVPKQKPRLRTSRRFSALVVVLLFISGAYLLILLQAPDLLISQASAATQSTEDALVGSNQNFIKIERINLMVPFNTGSTEATLEKGAWHRYPERGNPEKGGNFILSAHRFKLAMTPNATKERSPFYHLDKLQEKDTIDIYYNTKWYSYRVTKIFSVEPDAVEIEDETDTAQLTLYSCSLKGSSDGRVVVTAIPVGGTSLPESGSSNAPLL